MNAAFDINSIDWNKAEGLIPTIVQDARSLRVLMLGYVNPESLQKTLETKLVTFYSRSKQRLWQKGERSGHVLRMQSMRLDCDGDTILITANPEGPTCHLGTQTCFGENDTPSLAVLADLAATIRSRHLSPEPGSYTTKLFEQGILRMAQKVGEEGVETALAATTNSPTLKEEAADLLYHLLVLLEGSGTDWMDVLKVLQDRRDAKR